MAIHFLLERMELIAFLLERMKLIAIDDWRK